MEIRKDVSLAGYTTWRIGGNARFFCDATSLAEVAEAFEFAASNNLATLILGGGSNLLISDKGFDGLVIRIKIMGREKVIVNGEMRCDGVIKIGAGENWDDIVEYTISERMYGLENLSLIPGTVGAAPVQNIGAYGVEIAKFIKSVEVFDTLEKKSKELSASECGFSYRDSIFKHAEGSHYVITSVTFKLSIEPDADIRYKDLAEYYKTHSSHPMSPKGVRAAVIDIRTAKLPDVKEFGTAGSFWKNPIIPAAQYSSLLKKYPELPSYPAPDRNGESMVKIPLAWVVDKVCGYKGERKGNVGTYKSQALVLVNYGNATFEEVDAFARNIENVIKDYTGLIVEREVICK